MPATMHKKFFTYLSIIFFTAILFIYTGCADRAAYSRITGFAQGGEYHITYSDRDCSGKRVKISTAKMTALIDKALLEIDNSLSGYNKGSILTTVNSNKEVELDSLFVELFNRSLEIYDESDGIFDISSAPLFDIWGFGFSDKEAVTPEKIDSILAFTGMDKVELSGLRLIKSDPRVRLNFNAIAQGYSCDYVARIFDSLNICDYLIEIGGEILCKGKNPKGKKWSIAVDTPIDGNMEMGESVQDIIEITDAGVVTSGNYRKYYIENGEKFSHTIDPRTGYPTKHNLLSATIITSDATTADAYATWCMVIGLDESIKFLESRGDLEGYLIYDDDGIMKTHYTKGITLK